MMIDIWGIIYILSVTFQLAAGLLLLIGNTKTSKKAIALKYCSQHRGFIVKRSGYLRDYTELLEVAKTVWINKLAFIYLILGYLIGIFGICPPQKLVVFLSVIILAMLLLCISFAFAKYKAGKYNSLNFNEIPPAKDTTMYFIDE